MGGVLIGGASLLAADFDAVLRCMPDERFRTDEAADAAEPAASPKAVPKPTPTPAIRAPQPQAASPPPADKPAPTVPAPQAAA